MYFKSRNTKIQLQLIVILFLITLIKAERVLRFGVKKIDIWTDPAYCTFKQVIDESVPVANNSLKISKDVQDAVVRIESTATSRTNGDQYIIVNGSHSVCKVLEIKNASPIAMLVYSQLKRFGHLPDACPLKKDTYSFNNFWPDDHPTKFKFPEVDIHGRIVANAIEDGAKTKVLDVSFIAEYAYKEVTAISRSGLMNVLQTVATGVGRRR